MLQAHQIDIAKIQEIRSLPVRAQIILAQFKSHPRRIAVALFYIVDWQREQFSGCVFSVNGVAQIRCEGGDPTLPR
jgi:hypothetical protein